MSVSQNFVTSQIEDIDAAIRNLDKQKEGLLVIRRAAQSVLNGSPVESGVGTGFRDAVRQALKGRPQGLTGKEIVHELRSSGELSKYRGLTKPSVRVHNELYSLRGKGEVVRQNKRYKLKGQPPIALVGLPVRQ